MDRSVAEVFPNIMLTFFVHEKYTFSWWCIVCARLPSDGSSVRYTPLVVIGTHPCGILAKIMLLRHRSGLFSCSENKENKEETFLYTRSRHTFVFSLSFVVATSQKICVAALHVIFEMLTSLLIACLLVSFSDLSFWVVISCWVQLSAVQPTNATPLEAVLHRVTSFVQPGRL